MAERLYLPDLVGTNLPFVLGVYTTSTRPTASLWPNHLIIVSDATSGQEVQRSDGSAWVPVGGGGGTDPLTPTWTLPTLVSGNTYSLPNPVNQYLLLWQRALILTEDYHYTRSGSQFTLLGETTSGANDRAQPIIDQIAANGGNLAGILEALRYTGYAPQNPATLADLIMSYRPRAYWPLTSYAGGQTPEYSGNGGAATGVGAPTIANGFISLNGSSGLQWNGMGFSGRQSLTICAWFKTAVNDGTIYQQRDTNNNGQVEVGISTGNLAVFAWNTVPEVSFATTNTYNDNNWHHIAVTRNLRGSWAIYIDGQLVQTASPSNRINLNPEITASMGYDQRDNARYLTGQLAHVVLFDYVLSAAQISELYSRGR